MTTTDPLSPRAHDAALLSRLRSDASMFRNLVKRLECWARQAEGSRSGEVLEEASDAIRVLSHEVRRK